jgi:hypothetical protein
MAVMESEITVAPMAESPIAMGSVINRDISRGFISEFTQFCDASNTPRLNVSYPIGAYFESMEAFSESPDMPSRLFSMDPKGKDRKEAGLYLIGYARGYYGQANDLPKRMTEFAEKNGYEFVGPVYNIYLQDELSQADTKDYLLQAAASVRETRGLPLDHMRRHLK